MFIATGDRFNMRDGNSPIASGSVPCQLGLRCGPLRLIPDRFILYKGSKQHIQLEIDSSLEPILNCRRLSSYCWTVPGLSRGFSLTSNAVGSGGGTGGAAAITLPILEKLFLKSK